MSGCYPHIFAVNIYAKSVIVWMRMQLPEEVLKMEEVIEAIGHTKVCFGGMRMDSRRTLSHDDENFPVPSRANKHHTIA